MSTKVMALIWAHYRAKRFKVPKITVLSLADEADDSGGGIFQSAIGLSGKADVDERTMRRQLRALEAAGLLSCRKRSSGGVGVFSEYSLNLSALFEQENGGIMPGLTGALCPGSESLNGGIMPGFAPLYEGGKGGAVQSSTYILDKSVKVSANPGIDAQAEYRRMAEWMFGSLVKLNPKLKPPKWHDWTREVRLMVERDKVSLREVGELFKFANEHPFWCSNILSPGSLRKQWNKLLMARGQVVPALAAPVRVDRRCAGSPSRASCDGLATTERKGKWQCRQCLAENERAGVYG